MKNINDLKLKRIVMEVFGGCNYTCQMCPQSNPGRGKNFTRKISFNLCVIFWDFQGDEKFQHGSTNQ